MEQRKYIEEARWFALRVLQVVGSVGATVRMCQATMDRDACAISEHEARTELRYLEDKRLVIIDDGGDQKNWRVRLSGKGKDFVEGRHPPVVGVYRPRQFGG